MIIEEVFCEIDDFCKIFIPKFESKLIESGDKIRRRKSKLSPSEIMTILILYHDYNYKNFKSYYQEHVVTNLKEYFPDLLSYNRFVSLIPSILIPMAVYLQRCLSFSTGISYVDSTSIAVCSNKRTNSHKVFKDIATMGKTTKGWFYGLKLHLLCNHKGELLNINFTSGNSNDLKPLNKLVNNVTGKLFGDKGYISKTMVKKLSEKGIQLVTSARKNMKNYVINAFDKVLLKKRSMIESVINQLKNVFSIEHTRHRNYINALTHMISSLIGYCKYDKKAKINIDELTMTTASN